MSVKAPAPANRKRDLPWWRYPVGCLLFIPGGFIGSFLLGVVGLIAVSNGDPTGLQSGRFPFLQAALPWGFGLFTSLVFLNIVRRAYGHRVRLIYFFLAFGWATFAGFARTVTQDMDSRMGHEQRP